MVNVESLQPFPAKSNPFLFDEFRMGADTTDHIFVMWGLEKNDIILVYLPTGERVRVNFRKDREESVNIIKQLGLRNEYNNLARMVQEAKRNE